MKGRLGGPFFLLFGKAAFEAMIPLGAVAFSMLAFAILTHIMR